MEPVSSNLQSKTCPDTINSNCVTWGGANVPGTCKGASITDVITKLQTTCCGNPDSPCYSNSWVDISGTIPLSGSGADYNYTLTNLGAGGGYAPEYKWTKDGDLSVRGILDLNITVTSTRGFVFIPLVTIPTSCFPAGFTANQYVLCAADSFAGSINADSPCCATIVFANMFLEYPTGRLMLHYQYNNPSLIPVTFNIDLGGTRFNIA
jgi:hypothetical protein